MIDAIRTFLAVVEAGNLSKVARSRDVAVSSVTRKIDALEQELGVKLLRRSSRALLLTDAGELFLPRARAIDQEYDNARQDIAAQSSDPRGLLSVAAPSAFGRRHVAPAVLSFMRKYPLIEIDLHLSDDLLDLRVQRVDVAVRIGVLADSDLVASRLAPQQRMACASPAYLARHGRPATPEDLLQHNCLTMATHPVPQGWWNFSGDISGAPLPVRGSFRCDDTEVLMQAALDGVGIVHMSTWLVSEHVAAGRLVQLFPIPAPRGAARRAAIQAVRLPGRSHAAKAQLFIEHLRGAFGAPPYWDRELEVHE
jgi:DNA-binding transcriptional LysR family regulator